MTSPAERFTGLFERTHADLLAYALRRVAEPSDAADVVADTYLVAWRRLDQVPAAAERPWLFGVARKVLANHNRSTRRRHSMAARLRSELQGFTAEPQTGEAVTLGRALDSLPASDRELLRLLAWEELTHAELAVALGIGPGAVRVRLHRARARLQAALDGLESTPDDLTSATGRN